jgi:hypothetical protein
MKVHLPYVPPVYQSPERLKRFSWPGSFPIMWFPNWKTGRQDPLIGIALHPSE